MDRADQLARLEADLADDEAQELREQVASEIPLRLSENALRLLIHHQTGGDSAGTGFATATEMAAALGDGARVLFASARWYAGAGLVRQLIECQYLIQLMGDDRSEAERWAQADHDQIVSTFMPRHMRERAVVEFRASEYRVRSDWAAIRTLPAAACCPTIATSDPYHSASSGWISPSTSPSVGPRLKPRSRPSIHVEIRTILCTRPSDLLTEAMT